MSAKNSLPLSNPASDRVFRAVAFLLFSTGWAANHFASMLPVLREDQALSSMTVNIAFGVYAVGIMPGLLGGGQLVNRIGPRRLVLIGATAAMLGNLYMSIWHDALSIILARLLLGVGVGLTVSAGTAWAARLRGIHGATFAGFILTAGFAAGPIASGLVALLVPAATRVSVPFVVSVLLSAAAIVMALLVREDRSLTHATGQILSHMGPTPTAGSDSVASNSTNPRSASADATPRPHPRRSVARALTASLPMALWVFASITTAVVIVPSRLDIPTGYEAILPGAAAAVGFGAGLSIQAQARRASWGPFSGVAGALCAATGFVLVALGGLAIPLWLAVLAAIFLGSAYGLSLRDGLIDVERLSPPASRGTVSGLFYMCTYLGFGLPVLLEALLPTFGAALPLAILAGLAILAAIGRTTHILMTDQLKR